MRGSTVFVSGNMGFDQHTNSKEAIHGSAKQWEKPFFLIVARGRGENESAMALTGFLLVDIIATVPSDNIFVN